MIEALLLMAAIFFMILLLRSVSRSSTEKSGDCDLGLFAYKQNRNDPVKEE